MSDSEVAEGVTELLQTIHSNIDLPKPRYNSTQLAIVVLESKFNIKIVLVGLLAILGLATHSHWGLTATQQPGLRRGIR